MTCEKFTRNTILLQFKNLEVDTDIIAKHWSATLLGIDIKQ